MIASNHTTAATVLHGDCRKLLPTLGKFEFIFADPPFNIGHGYIGYDDRREDFEPFTEEWIAACWEACDGVLALHGPTELLPLYFRAAERHQMRLLRHIVLYFAFGQNIDVNWPVCHANCLIFAKHASHTWNPDEVLIKARRLTTYADSRTEESRRKGLVVPGSVWGFDESTVSNDQVAGGLPNWGRVQGNNAERRPGHPNQLPEVYLERLLLAYTNEGDRVLDPFGGSGTTAVVAEALGRQCVTCDVSEHNVGSIRDRLAKGVVRVARRVATGHPD